MTPVQIASLLDPVFWVILGILTWSAYRLPKWSAIRRVLMFATFPLMIGVMYLQTHLLNVLEPAFHQKHVDDLLFPDLFGGIFIIICIVIREERAKKRRESSAR